MAAMGARRPARRLFACVHGTRASTQEIHMNRYPLRVALLVAANALLSGCAGLPADRGAAGVAALVGSRTDSGLAAEVGVPDADTRQARVAVMTAVMIDPHAAMRLAIANNPRTRQVYARLGIAQADVYNAARIPNPTFGFSDLRPGGDGASQITRSVGIDLAALLTLVPRKRLAAADLDRVQLELAHEVLMLAAEAEAAWYRYAGACQVAQMRERVEAVAGLSADFAQRMHEAGNLNALELALEQAAATQARLDTAGADARMLVARAELASLLGLPTRGEWRIDDRLPAPPSAAPALDGLLETALAQRLDLAAVRQELAVLEDGANVSRRWRWLGTFDLGYERESETDGGTLRGPTVTLALPLFNQGQGAVARSQAQVEDARARLDAAELGVRNEIALGLDRLDTSRAITERYRSALLPQREAVVARTQEQVNFMFQGVFELLRVKREQYDAYEAYLEAVRDYWIDRASLRRAAGGRLPDDSVALEPAIGVDSMIPAANTPAPEGAAVIDPHAGHAPTRSRRESPARDVPAVTPDPPDHEHHQRDQA